MEHEVLEEDNLGERVQGVAETIKSVSRRPDGRRRAHARAVEPAHARLPPAGLHLYQALEGHEGPRPCDYPAE